MNLFPGFTNRKLRTSGATINVSFGQGLGSTKSIHRAKITACM